MSYPIVKLAEVCEFRKGKKPKAFVSADSPNSKPYILIEHFGGSRSLFADDQHCTSCETDDTLIVCDGARTGLCSIGNAGYIGSTIAALVPDKTKIHPQYLFHFVSSNYNLISSRVRGAAVPHIDREFFLSLAFALPPLPEQQRLVRILDEADGLRQLRARADTRTNDFIPALFNEMFGDPATNPKGWKVVANQELFANGRAGTKCGPFGSALKKHEYVENGIPVWGIDNVLPNQFVEEGSLFITREKFEQLENYNVEPGDILVSRAGTVGRMCVARPKQWPSIIGSNLIRLSFDQNQIVPEYFTTLFTYSPQATSRFRANSDEGAYSFMNTGTLKTLNIPVPPIALQREFAARVGEVRAMQTQQARSRQRLEDLFQALLHRAFSGEL